MNIIKTLPNQDMQFYPTPEKLTSKILEGLNLRRISRVLEPSAGKGDLAFAFVKKCDRYQNIDIDMIEIDSNLRSILRGKIEEWKDLEKNDRSYNQKFRIVGEDFLNYHTCYRYDLILMNPPFKDADVHLLKALQMVKHNGGSIICIMNANTLRKANTRTRIKLLEQLSSVGANVDYLEDAFVDAERKTNVSIAVVKVDVQQPEDNAKESYFFSKLEKAKEKTFTSDQEENNELIYSDQIKRMVQDYEVEVRAGIEFIDEYLRISPRLRNSLNSDYSSPLLELKTCEGGLDKNDFIKSVRRSYWEAIFNNKKLMSHFTSNLSDRYRKRVGEFENYEFSEFNLRELFLEMKSHIYSNIKEEILKKFEELTTSHSYNNSKENNRYLFDAWKTNKGWKVNNKVILPFYRAFKTSYKSDSRRGFHEYTTDQIDTYRVYKDLSDLERILNFFAGETTADVDLQSVLENAAAKEVSKKISCKHFYVDFFKKGTAHIVFKDEKLIDAFNIYVAKEKHWLPESYGKKTYQQFTEEERAVVDSFQGKKAYEEVMAHREYYLKEPGVKLLACS